MRIGLPSVGTSTSLRRLDWLREVRLIVYRILRYILLLEVAVPAFVFAQVGPSQKPSGNLSRTSSIDLRHALAPATPCRTFQQRIQFFSETSLLVLSGPSGDCYRSVNQVSLNVISTDGHLLARKPWPSTDPGMVIDNGRLVLALSADLEVDDKSLTPIQTLKLPPHRFIPAVRRMDQQGAVTLSMEGKNYTYGGTPLALLNQGQPDQRGVSKKVFSFSNGQTITQEGEVLKLEGEGDAARTIANLNWVMPPCGRYMNCQAYEAGASIQVSAGRKRRVLVYSNGSRFPVTDAAGLFPYFRLQVFDLDTGAELYREEDIVRTGDRGAAISPDGDRLATTDGQKVVLHSLL